jgi:hypothetical protein
MHSYSKIFSAEVGQRDISCGRDRKVDTLSARDVTSKSPRCMIHKLSSWSPESWIPYCKIISNKGTRAKVLYPSQKSSQRDVVPLKGLPIPLHDQKTRCQQLVHPVKAEIFYMWICRNLVGSNLGTLVPDRFMHPPHPTKARSPFCFAEQFVL